LFITSCTIIHSPFIRLNNQNIKSTDKTVTIIIISKNKLSLTHIGKETTFIIKMFKYINFKTAFKTNNSKQYNLRTPPKLKTIIANYVPSCIHKLTYPDCGQAYVGQTGSLMPRGLKKTFFL
jgi:hypothetical protein